MAQILVRNLPEKTLRRLKDRAKRAGRSLQAEAKQILEHEATRMSWEEFRETTARFRAEIAKRGPQKTDSTDLIREDRDR